MNKFIPGLALVAVLGFVGCKKAEEGTKADATVPAAEVKTEEVKKEETTAPAAEEPKKEEAAPAAAEEPKKEEVKK